MKKLISILLWVMSMSMTAASHADVLYSFTTAYNDPISPNSFSFVADDFITVDSHVAAADLQSCETNGFACIGADFYINARDHGFSADPVPVIKLTRDDPDYDALNSSYYYFAPASFITPGVHATLYGFNPGVLTVIELASTEVPEPMPAALLLFGSALFAVHRKRRR